MKRRQQALLVHVFMTLYNAGSFYLEFHLPLSCLSGLSFIYQVQLEIFSPRHSSLLPLYYCYPKLALLLINLSYCMEIISLMVCLPHYSVSSLYKVCGARKCSINKCFHLIELNSEKVAPLASSSSSIR